MSHSPSEAKCFILEFPPYDGTTGDVSNLFLNLKLLIFSLFLLLFDKIYSNFLRDFESLDVRTDLFSSSNRILIPKKKYILPREILKADWPEHDDTMVDQ